MNHCPIQNNLLFVMQLRNISARFNDLRDYLWRPDFFSGITDRSVMFLSSLLISNVREAESPGGERKFLSRIPLGCLAREKRESRNSEKLSSSHFISPFFLVLSLFLFLQLRRLIIRVAPPTPAINSTLA